jgi:hypothetical protein
LWNDDNARYWFRRVGPHAVLPAIGLEVSHRLTEAGFRSRLGFDRVLDRRGHWDPLAFVDLCADCARTWNTKAQAAAELQEIELRLLLEHTIRAAQSEA